MSFLNHARIMRGYFGSAELFVETFVNDVCMYGPFFKHVLSFWNKRHMPNVLFITYEEMKRDLASVIRRTSQFLGKPVPEEKMDSFVKHLSFNSMKNNDAVNQSAAVEVMAYKEVQQ